MDEGIAGAGLTFGLLLASLGFGFRHGIDWDHIAAITDITSSQEDRRASIWFATLYALGHAAVVLVLGVIAIVAGDFVPEGVDAIMGRVVGATLLLLGVYVVVSLIRHGRDFRLRSRWMLVFGAVRRGWRALRRNRPSAALDSPSEDETVAGSPEGTSSASSSSEPPGVWHHGHHGRPGHHHHTGDDPDEPFMNYGPGTSLGIGMIHGIGAETPSQVILFFTAAGAGGTAAGIAVLVAFIVGLLASNSLIALGSAYGFLRAQSNFAVYATVAVVTAVFSLVLGTLFVLGKETVLPALFAG